jgi:hypothetical protein
MAREILLGQCPHEFIHARQQPPLHVIARTKRARPVRSSQRRQARDLVA